MGKALKMVEKKGYAFDRMNYTYTVLMECLSEIRPADAFICLTGDAYYDFDDAYSVARQWAVKEWERGFFYEFISGYFTKRVFGNFLWF